MTDRPIALTVVTARRRPEATVKADGSDIVRTARVTRAKTSAMGATIDLDPAHGRELVDALCAALGYWPEDPRVTEQRDALAALADERRHLAVIDAAHESIAADPDPWGPGR